MWIDNQELLKQLREWSDSGENAKIVSAARMLPKSELSDEALTVIADAYIEEKDYKSAVNLLEAQRPRLDNDYHWQFRVGMALFFTAFDSEYEDDEEMRRGILERSRVAFARCMNLNPPENVLDEAGDFLDRIEDEMYEFDGDDDFDDDECEVYDDEELDTIEEHIEEYFGEFPTIFHEIRSPDIHCDIYIVPPTEKRDYYTLITVGMGAHIMDIPESLEQEELGRAELMICLPKDWKIGENSPEWFWPISLLKNLARLPIISQTWLGWGHSVDNKDEFSDNTKLCGSLLIYPEEVESGADTCRLPNGDTVNFLEIVPLYREEMNFKIDYDTHELLEKMNGVSHILDINRLNTCEGYIKRDLIDTAETHCNKIVEKGLKLDVINSCNHIAVFLRWCIEHDLYNRFFFDRFPGVVEGIKFKDNTDLRKFLMDCTHGELSSRAFSFLGYMFTRRYYDFDNSFEDCFFPADVDSCAEEYFGTERYNSEEFQDEAYLFVPFDEDYYERLSKYINRAYDIFLPEYLDYFYSTNLPTVKTAEEILGHECLFLKDQREFGARYTSVRKENSGKELFPIIIAVTATDELSDDIGSSTEVLSHVLFNCDEPFMISMVLLISDGDFLGNFDTENIVEIDSDNVRETAQEYERNFGEKPFVLEISGNRANLFAPKGDGSYMLFKGEKP